MGGVYYFTFVHSSFLRTSMIAPGQFPGCVQSQWNDKSRIWQNSHYRNQRGPWRRHLADSSSNLCNRAKVPACCLKYERVIHSSGTFNPLILNGVKQVYSFQRQCWGVGGRDNCPVLPAAEVLWKALAWLASISWAHCKLSTSGAVSSTAARSVLAFPLWCKCSHMSLRHAPGSKSCFIAVVESTMCTFDFPKSNVAWHVCLLLKDPAVLYV